MNLSTLNLLWVAALVGLVAEAGAPAGRVEATLNFLLETKNRRTA